MIVLIEIVIFPFILFVSGFLITKRYFSYKKWEKSFYMTLVVNLTWLILNIFFLLIFIINFSDIFPFKIIISIINLILGFVILHFVFKQELITSLKTIILIQSALMIFWLLLSYIQIIVSIFLLNLNDDFNNSKLFFLASIIFLLGLSIFIANWGDKVQLIKFRRTFILSSITPAIFFSIIVYILQPMSFLMNSILLTIIGLVINIISIFFTKKIAYKTIEFGDLRELTIIEKGLPLLEVKDLHVHYPLLKGAFKRQVGSIKAVNGVSFSVKTGETLGLVGESGCGKTTIAKTILGLLEKIKGDILFKGNSVPKEYTSYLRRKIQMVFQDPDASLNSRLKIVDIIGEPIRNLLGITNKTEIRKYVLKLLEKVSLKREHMDRYPHEFSGGQKQRIVIARALACNPELIILDEPTSALDVSVQAQILNLLKDLQKEFGYGFLFITHNLSVVNHIADRIAVMYLGNFVEIGSTEQIFNNLTHPYTKALLNSRSDIDPNNTEIKFVIKGEVPSALNPPNGCAFNPRCSSDARSKECEKDFPHKIKIEDDHYIWCINEPISLKKEKQIN